MRILAIGDTESLAETRRVLTRSEFEMLRVPAALAAVRMLRRIPFDLMIVVHPLVDTDFAGFHREIRAADSLSRSSQLLVLSPHSRLAELDGFRSDPRLEAVDVDLPQHRLAEAAARYLGPIRAAKRYDLRLEALWSEAGQRGRTEDISVSGALIAPASVARPAIGERLTLQLTAAGSPIVLPSETVRVTEAPPDKARGFAGTWIGARAAALERLEDLLAERGRGRNRLR
jgi:hypothetical protein